MPSTTSLSAVACRPTDCVRATIPKGFADGDVFLERGRCRKVGALKVVAVATAVFLGLPRPVEGVKFGAEAEGLAGKMFCLGLLLDKQDEESGTTEAGVVVEVVHLWGAVVEFQGQSDGQGTFRDGDLVGTRTAVRGDEGCNGR